MVSIDDAADFLPVEDVGAQQARLYARLALAAIQHMHGKFIGYPRSPEHVNPARWSDRVGDVGAAASISPTSLHPVAHVAPEPSTTRPRPPTPIMYHRPFDLVSVLAT